MKPKAATDRHGHLQDKACFAFYWEEQNLLRQNNPFKASMKLQIIMDTCKVSLISHFAEQTRFIESKQHLQG